MHLMNCPVCGKRIPINSSVCPECKFDLTEYTKKPEVKAHRINWRVIILIAISLFIVVIGLILFKLISTSISNSETSDIVEVEIEDDNVTDPEADEEVEIISPSPSKKKSTAKETPKPEITPSSESSIDSNSSTLPVGVYSGDDGNILVINENGYAYYYCTYVQFTEIECPWEYSEGTLTIQFYKMHCLAYADIQDDDFSEILLRSDSANWNPELFERINVSPDDYLKRKVETNDKAVSVESDGSMTFSIDDLTFSIPKQFQDGPDDSDDSSKFFIFVDNDIESNFVSALLFYKDKAPAEEDFPTRFMNNVEIESPTKTTVAGRKATTYKISGTLNKGFSGLTGYNQTGTCTIISNPNNKSLVYVLMIQTEDRPIDNTEEFQRILDNCIEE